jgi:aspartate/methionine/tyrosine aminotransferase
MSSFDKQLSFLSHRSQALAKPKSSHNPIWDVYLNQWDPQENPNGYVSLGVAENRLMHGELQQYINKRLDVSDHAFTYGDGPRGTKRLLKAAARFLNRKFNPIIPIETEHITVTNGVTTAIEHVSWAFCNPGDGFLLGQPYYGAFIADIALRPGVEVVQVPFNGVDPMSIEGVANYEQSILSAKERGITIKALMLCSPHNPLGRCYSRDTIIAVLGLCQKYRIHFVSDEIYGLTVWENKHDKDPSPIPFTSILSIPLDGIIEPFLVHALWGMSKDFGANGLRVGFIISQHNQAFVKSLVEVALYSSASSVTQHITANILEDDAWTDNYIRTNKVRLSESHSFMIEFLKKHQIPYTPGSNAAFFVWADLGRAYAQRHGISNVDDGLAERLSQLLMQRKVFLASGVHFGSETPGIFRIVFSHPRPYVEEGLWRILDIIEGKN